MTLFHQCLSCLLCAIGDDRASSNLYIERATVSRHTGRTVSMSESAAVMYYSLVRGTDTSGCSLQLYQALYSTLLASSKKAAPSFRGSWVRVVYGVLLKVWSINTNTFINNLSYIFG